MKLILITYIDRSGSTLLTYQLSRHKQIFVFPEAGYLSGMLLHHPFDRFELSGSKLRRIYEDLKTHHQLKYWPVQELLERANTQTITNFDFFLEMLKAYAIVNGHNESIWVFKQRNLLSIFQNRQKLSKNGVEIFCIGLIRDPRAVFFSGTQILKNFPQFSFSRNPLILTYTWLNFLEYANRYNKSSDFLLLSYKNLIKDFESTIYKICLFIGISDTTEEWSEQGKLYNLLSPEDKKMHQNILRPPDSSKIYFWKQKLKPVLVKIIEQYALQKLHSDEYQLTNPKVNSIVKNLLILYFKLRIFIGLDRY
ncbi:MAG: sulfotransferase [Bacteroidales bacterium]|nr:sulfotransferase [Bacteroidales bacterium]